MRRTILLLIGAACCLDKLPAGDVIFLAGGDRISGTVQKLHDGKLFVDSTYSDTPLQFDWGMVAGITTESEVRVTMKDGKADTGTLQTSAGGLEFVTPAGRRAIQSFNVISLEPVSPQVQTVPSHWFRRILDNSSISADFDQTFSGLESYNQLSSNSEIDYAGDRWDSSLVTHYYYYGATDSAGSTYQAYGRLIGQRYIHGDRFFLFPYAFLGRQTTSDGGSGQIRQYGGGIGWTFKRQQSDQLSLYTGIVRSVAHGFTITSDEQRADIQADEPLFLAAASWETELARKITASVRIYYFKPILQPGHNALAMDTSVKIPVFRMAYFTVGAYDSPEVNQKQLFSTKNLQISSGFGIEF